MRSSMSTEPPTGYAGLEDEYEHEHRFAEHEHVE